MITFNNVNFSYGSVKALDSITLTIDANSMLAVVGNNGAGKSTLIKLIAGLIKPVRGEVQTSKNTRFAYLPQQTNLNHHFPMRVIDVVKMGLWPFVGSLKRASCEQIDQVHQAIEILGLKGLENRSLDSLSGGQFQRMLFARMMVQNADVLLLDEPFVGVDHDAATGLIEQLNRWHAEGKTIITVLHDYYVVETYFPKTLLLSNAMIAYGETSFVLNQKNLNKAAFCS